MKKYYILILFYIFIISHISAQRNIKEFQDGKLYFKIKDNYELNIRVNRDKSVNIDDLCFIKKLKEKYSITKLTRPFDIDNDSKLLKTYYLEFKNYDKIDELVNNLKLNDTIEYAEKIPVFQLCISPIDPYYNSTQGDFNINWHLDRIHAEEAWDITKGSPDVKIAIVDNAVWSSHEDLQGKVLLQYDYGDAVANANPPNTSDNTVRQNWSHGTHVAGLAAANTNNNTGVAAIGYNCSLIALKATSTEAYLEYPYECINWAANHGADVINMSFGNPSINITTAKNILNAAAKKGIILVAAAGNGGTSQLWYPAAYSNVISVGSTDDNDNLSSFSQYGSWVNIAAPGGYSKSPTQSFQLGLISTTYSTNQIAGFCPGYYNPMSGTSMSSPLVAGFCGLVKSLDKSITATQIKQCLQSSSDPLTGGNTIGAGRMNALKALNCLGFYHAPVVDFTSNTKVVVMGNSVQFTDLSSQLPLSWEWTFEGGIPSNSSIQNPNVSYHTTGTYKVTLKAVNKGGNNSLTKEAYITVVEPATSCDSIGYPYTQTLMLNLTGNNGGYMSGTNSYGDKAKANYFDSYTGMTILTGAMFAFGAASGTGNVECAVWDNSGLNGSPGKKIGSKIIPLSSIHVGTKTVPKYTTVLFDQAVLINSPFYIGIILPSFPSNRVALIHTKDGEAHPYLGYGWEEFSYNSWGPYTKSYGNITNIICPIVCPSGRISLSDNFNIYPNPTNSVINIDFKGNMYDKIDVEIYSILGQLKYKNYTNNLSSLIQLNMADLTSGIYIVKVYTDSRLLNNKKITVISYP